MKPYREWSGTIDFFNAQLFSPILHLKTCSELDLKKKVYSVIFTDGDDFINSNPDIFNGLGSVRKNCHIQLEPRLKPNSIRVAEPRWVLLIKKKIG